MKISVISPIYHGKQYIPQILGMMERNLMQTKLNYELELIFVNDDPGQPIEEHEIASKLFTTKLVVNEKNGGIHFSRVQGLMASTGEYVMFFDQDDYIDDHYFESQLSKIEKEKASVVVANGIAQAPGWDKLLYKYWFMQWTTKHMWFYTRFDCRIISPGQCLIKKSVIPNIWTTEVLTRNGADDFYLWLILLAGKEKFCINRDCLYTHVYTANNTSLDNSEMKASVQQFLDIDQKYHLIPKYHHQMIEDRIQGKANFAVLTKVIERLNKK